MSINLRDRISDWARFVFQVSGGDQNKALRQWAARLKCPMMDTLERLLTK
ncbi:MAG: hypothetical protein Q8O82_09875 [Pseudorhodobacter sp.]|nr:hypothetical protein [Pseudorhodobacter sp.]